MKKTAESFYLQPTHTVARGLLGKYIVKDDVVLKITETESYIGAVDKACHAYGGKVTERTKILYHKGGVFYIYLIYGMYCCLNVIAEEEGTACGALIRGAEAVKGFDTVSMRRFGVKYSELTPYRRKNLLNGPGKVCMALGIDRSYNGMSCLSEEFYIAEGEKISAESIHCGKRIGIDYAEEAKDFLWRYYI